MAFLAGTKITADQLGKIGATAKYSRRTGSQVLNSGDQILQFPTTVKSIPGVTPQGTNNTSFLLDPGAWIISCALRLNTNGIVAIFLATGTSFSEGNALTVGNIVNGLQGSLSEPLEITTATSVCAGVFRDLSTSCSVVSWGNDMTHIGFIRLS